MIINFSIEEIAFAIDLGRKRNNSKNEKWRNNDSGFHKNVKGREYPHIIGVIGELAFAKASNMPIDLNLYEKGDKGWDFNGIDVKTTLHNPKKAKLIIRQKDLDKQGDQTKYVLVCISENYKSAEMVGYISKSVFLQLKKPWLKENTWFVERNKLLPINDVLKSLRK